ncbi:MAG: deoxyhypusine synthase [Desulfurococcaceae archaeon]
MTIDLINDARKDLLKDLIMDYEVNPEMTICELIEKMGNAHGFMAGHVLKASQILADMLRDSEVTRILAFTGNIIATGLRGLIAQVLGENWFHAVITTCGAIDHDIARSLGGTYHRGDWLYDDSMLHVIGINRLGNVLIPVENYGLLIERFARRVLEDLSKIKKKWSVSDLLREAGKRLNDKHSLIRVASQRMIPIFIPGIYDGAFGSQVVFNYNALGLELDIIQDEKKIIELIVSSKKLGALIIGGGISKHHTIWWAQLKNGLDYAIYLTTAVEYDGSLSGAHPREAISWGKIKPSGRSIVVYGDATITMPLIIAGAMCELRRA